MESKKLEKPCENATFQALQGVMKPDEETGGVFPTKNALPAWEGVRTMYSQTEMIFQAHQSRSSAITALTNL